MDNGFTDPTEAINILQKYQMDCKIANDLLNAHLNIVHYPKFKKLIDSITNAAEEFVGISQKEIDQYSDFRIFKHKDSALKMINIEKEHPGSFSKEDISFNEESIEKNKTISYENINLQIAQLNKEFVNAYEDKYRSLLQLMRSTFDTIILETQQQADCMLCFGKICNQASTKRSRKKKGNKDGSN